MQYSLITLSYNKLDCTKRCLSAILERTAKREPWELIVVDNGSTDGSAAWCSQELQDLGKQHGIAIKVILNQENCGAAQARNQGIAVASGKYLVFVDNDIIPSQKNWMQLLREPLETTPGVGMCGAKLIYPWPPYPIQCAGVGISRRGHVCFLGRGKPRNTPEFNQQRLVQCLISACLMIPATLIAEHGGFDIVFHPVQFEDFDLVYRLREAGYHALYVPGVEMYHFESVTTQGSPAICNPATVIRNGLLFQKRWHHLFSREEGPPESACRWQKIELPAFNSIGEVPWGAD